MRVKIFFKRFLSLLNRVTPRLSRRFIVLSVIVGLVVLVLVLILPFYIINAHKQYIIQPDGDVSTKIGIVFGAGITEEGKPFKELEARLDASAQAIEDGQVEYLLVSGDNRFEHYNEPDAMKRYLVDEKNIDESKIVTDYAGRSTYETCERAQKVFEVDRAILFSAYSHLPRAIYTCRSFGIESYGIGNNVEANNASRREFLARSKAFFNIYLYGEKTILGEPLPIE